MELLTCASTNFIAVLFTCTALVMGNNNTLAITCVTVLVLLYSQPNWVVGDLCRQRSSICQWKTARIHKA